MKATEKDIDILARTLWAEARGEGFGGMIAAGWTVRNRVEMDLHNDGKPDWWGEGYTAVCLKPWQYSCWNKDDANYPFLSGAKPIPSAQYVRAREAAIAVIEGREPDPTAGATHYYNPKVVKKTPPWVKGAKPTVTIGNHRFFKEVP
ncbi:cell wall hydrolase [Pseudomonas sp. BN415]|uniref:cell wall hydrolase n=1 Tax=Pseudomonas sp. BN415 TaxID=2567889 RepID=UPI0024539670|nr:cell wall hydrolase [Pseudomonas sp. BN415]MDH4581393.1 cell wall hydrolase [Pseudomonas sp. BN415]